MKEIEKSDKALNNNSLKDEETVNIDNTEDNEEEYIGRDWKRIFLGIIFIFAATITWYVIQAILGH
ncbi:MAG: hypothetical protein ACTSQE_09785 [Candidatus Heimdallarchaeaceae archaeon]